MGEFFSDGEFVPLTREQRDILDRWGRLSDEEKKLIADLIAHMK